MERSVPQPAGTSPTSPGEPDMATRAVDLLDEVVGVVRDRAVRPVVVAARAVVFGIVAATLLSVAGVAIAIGLVRLLDVEVFGGRVWASDALIGVVACAVGAVAWAKRTTGATAP